MSEHRIRYIVGHGWAESVSEVTALPHRVLRINHAGDIDVRRSYAGKESVPILQISAAEIRFLARESRRAARRRFWMKLFGPSPRRSSTARTPDPSPYAKMRRERDAENAREIRALFTPMRREDGSLDTRKVAMEATMRAAHGLPSYIAELDGPGKVE